MTYTEIKEVCYNYLYELLVNCWFAAEVKWIIFAVCNAAASVGHL